MNWSEKEIYDELQNYLQLSGIDKKIIPLIHKKRIALGKEELPYLGHYYQIRSKIVYTICDADIGFDKVLAETPPAIYDLRDCYRRYYNIGDIISDFPISKKEFYDFMLLSKSFKDIIFDYINKKFYYQGFESYVNNDNIIELICDIKKIDESISKLTKSLNKLREEREKKIKILNLYSDDDYLVDKHGVKSI